MRTLPILSLNESSRRWSCLNTHLKFHHETLHKFPKNPSITTVYYCVNFEMLTYPIKLQKRLWLFEMAWVRTLQRQNSYSDLGETTRKFVHGQRNEVLELGSASKGCINQLTARAWNKFVHIRFAANAVLRNLPSFSWVRFEHEVVPSKMKFEDLLDFNINSGSASTWWKETTKCFLNVVPNVKNICLLNFIFQEHKKVCLVRHIIVKHATAVMVQIPRAL